MQKRLLLDSHRLDLTLRRLSQQLIENHRDFASTVLLGMQPRGIFVADRIAALLRELVDAPPPVGRLDATFFRDDFRRRATPVRPNATNVPFILEDQKVILIDDVLYTGRTVRAALDAMIAYGRPAQVELLALIDRKYTRHLPIDANYVGLAVDSALSQRVQVEWREQGCEEDKIWLVNA